MTNTTQPEVTQADEEIASEIEWQLSASLNETDRDVLRQFFARHRLTHSTPASDQEPVAWMYERGDKRVVSIGDRSEDMAPGWTETPLYASDRNAVLDEVIDAARGSNADMCRSPGEAYRTMLAAIRALRTEPAAQVEGEGE